MATAHRMLFFDIETAPLLAHAWQARVDYIGHHQILHDTYMISWAAKWADRRKVSSDVLTPEEAIAQDDGRLVASLADLLREADVIVAHNIDRFDLPMLRNRLLLLGLEPLGPVKTLDTVKLARRTFRLGSNSLDYLARMLGLPPKIETNYSLWQGCMHGEPAALKRMVKYNRQDVKVLEQVYEKLRPHVSGLPRLVDADGDMEAVCPACGSEDLQKRGFHRTNSSTFQRFYCKECGRWSRSRSADKAKRVATSPL